VHYLTLRTFQLKCKSYDAKLVEIESATEQLFLKDHVSYMTPTCGYFPAWASQRTSLTHTRTHARTLTYTRTHTHTSTHTHTHPEL